MVTQLQDISNKVAQSKISNSRLRNEEIRRQMAFPWSQPTMPSTTPTQVPTNPPLQNVFNPPQTPTMPSQLPSLGGDSSNESTGNPDFSRNDISSAVMGALPGMASTGAGMLGAGPLSGLAGAAVSGLQGNIPGAVQGVGNTFGALAGLKGYSGLVGQFAKDMYNDVDLGTMFGNLGKQAAMSAAFSAVPGLGAIYGLASLFGLNMDQGLKDTFTGYKGVPGFQGPFGGFFGAPALGLGVSDNGGWGGLPGDVPGFDSGDLGSGIGTSGIGIGTTGVGGLQGAMKGTFGGDYGDNFGGDPDPSGTGNTGNEAEGSGGPDGPAGEGGGEGGDGE